MAVDTQIPSTVADAAPTSIHLASAPTSIAGSTLSNAEREVYTRTFLDTDATTRANSPANFPFSGEELIELAKLASLRLVFTNDASILSDDFLFVGPVVGPLTKDKFMAAFTSFKVSDAFPDATTSLHDFRIDPFKPNRIFYTARFEGTHTGVLGGRIEPTGRTLRTGPQAASFTFNEQGKVSKMTVGYVMDREVGNTGGLGGVFALFYGIGSPLPFPECRPWAKSWQYRFFEWIGSVAASFKK